MKHFFTVSYSNHFLFILHNWLWKFKSKVRRHSSFTGLVNHIMAETCSREFWLSKLIDFFRLTITQNYVLFLCRELKTRCFFIFHTRRGSGQSFTRFLESFVTKSKIEITNMRRKENCVWSQAQRYVTSTIGNPTIHVSFYPDERGQNWSEEKESEQLSDYHSLYGRTAINLWPRSNQPTNKITNIKHY